MPSLSSNSHRAVGYFRVSTVSQSMERHVSLETQAERFASYCQQCNLVAVKTFTDTDTGRKDNRKEYQSMLRFLEDKTADLVIVQYLDRFGRNPKEILRRIWALQEVGVTVCATDEDIKEELILLVRAGLAGAESKKTSARTKANMRRAVAKGAHVGRVPFGFDGIRKICRDGKARYAEFVPNPTEAGTIRKMYELVAKHNLGYKAIADRLNDMGCKTKDGKLFESGTVRRILGDAAIKGTLVYGKRPRPEYKGDELIVIEKFFPTILTEHEWAEVQSRIAIRRDKHYHGRALISGFLLSGLARCGYCGGSMVGKTNRMPYGVYRRYLCRNALAARLKCPHANGHKAELLEKTVLEKLGGYSNRERTLKLLARLPPGKRDIENGNLGKDLKDCEREFDIHLRLLKEGRISDEQFSLANEPLRKKYEILLRRRKELEEEAQHHDKLQAWRRDMASKLSTFTEDFESLPFQQKKAKLIWCVSEIRVFKDKPVEIHLRDVPIPPVR